MLSGQNLQNRKMFKDKTKNISYIKGKLLGTGGFAKCYEAISCEDGRLYAAKVIPKKSIHQKRQRYKLLIEIKIHRSLKHKYIVQFIDAFEDKENIYILLQYCRNYTLKDLSKRRKRLTEFETRVYISQIVKAMIYIHSNGIIHRDLKLGNILINDQMDTKICDFGLSTKIKNQGDAKKTICGTPNYIAPEILEEQGHSYEVDIWSIGVIMYALLFGKPPFEDNTVEQTYENIKNNRYVFPANVQVSLAAKDMINRILVIDPARRLGLTQILGHQFMKFPEGIPHTIPVSSLAIPPIDYDKLPARINLNDMHLQLSQQIQCQSQNNNQDNIPIKIFKPPTSTFVYVRQCFKYENSIGYLLSNGIVGSINKKQKSNLIFQYGQQFYWQIKNHQKPLKHQIPETYDDNNSLMMLFHFKSFFVEKFSLFKIQQMKKRNLSNGQQSQKFVYMKKAMAINDFEIVTRLNNNIIQLHFNDLTSVVLNRQDEKGIFMVTRKGQFTEINYNQCKNNKTKRKIRRFSNLIQKLSVKQQEGQDENEDQQDDQEYVQDQSIEKNRSAHKNHHKDDHQLQNKLLKSKSNQK